MSGLPQERDQALTQILGDQTWMRRNLTYAVIIPAFLLVGGLTLWMAWRAGFRWEMAR